MKLLASLLALLCCSFVAASAQQPVVNVLGDSYVANHRRPASETWHAHWASAHQLRYNNYGRNGSCVAFDRSAEGFGPSLLVRYAQMEPAADLVIIVAGHNDAGFIKNSADSIAMFADSVALLIDRVRARCPKAELVWVTPWYVDREGFEPVVRTIRSVCRKKHVRVLNNYTSRSVIQVRDADFRRRYFQGPDDTAHLTADGHALFLPTAEKFLRKTLRRISRHASSQ